MFAVFGVTAWQQRLAASAMGESYVSSQTQHWDQALEEIRRVDLNSASAAELERLPGIGPTLAQRIITYRSKRGRYTDIEKLLKIKGIGKVSLEVLKNYIMVE